MHWNIEIISIFLCIVTSTFAYRDMFEEKCKRRCSVAEGSLECWTETTDGFAYGLSTAMIDFCRVIINLRNHTTDKEDWLNISQKILIEQIEQYSLDDDNQLSKDDIKDVAMTLLNKCFNSSLSVSTSEPPCSSCSKEQMQTVKQWRLSSIVILSIGVFLICLTLFLYALYSYYANNSYIPLP